jgi:hypothetical protein
VGETDGAPYVALEHLDGRTVRELLDEGDVDLEEAIRIGRAVASALCEAHRHRILHRDLKPENVMLLRDGAVKVLDFGLAKMVSDVALAADGTTIFLDEADTAAPTVAYERSPHRRIQGTPAYMSPEQWRGEAPTGATDVWALGLLLRELVFGEHPYRGLELIQVCALVASSSPIPAPNTDPPVELAPLLESCLAKEARSRPSAEEVLEAFDRLDGKVSVGMATVRRAPDRPTIGRWLLGFTLAGLCVVTFLVLNRQEPRVPPSMAEVLQQPFFDFVMEPNAEHSERTTLRHREAWDDTLFEDVQAQFSIYLARPRFFERLDEIWDEWGVVVAAAREAALPEVVAAIPYVETRYSREAQSSICAKGYWQLMPEVAVREGLKVRDCTFDDEPGTLWSPTASAPGHRLERIYEGPEGCRIPARMGCAEDERTDIAASTDAALASLKEAWEHHDIRATGAAVQLTVAVYSKGLDDRRFGVNRRVNVLPNVERWGTVVPDDEFPMIYGSSAACEDVEGREPPLNGDTRQYITEVIAAHLLAVCYYGGNYASEPVFRPWSKYTDGYCAALDVPTRAELATDWGEE